LWVNQVLARVPEHVAGRDEDRQASNEASWLAHRPVHGTGAGEAKTPDLLS
jgi:hypothetical protein